MSETITPEWTVTDRLVKARDTAGMTQDAMAERLGLSRKTIMWHEKSPPPWFAMAYAEVTGIRFEWIAGTDGGPDRPSDLPFSPSACYGGGAEILAFPTRVMGSKVA